ncbi:hypothetical protein [Butyrivibrio sp. YAB3001]|uniref:hypothetical protein n=1 Tax=Butyrivibrio sp. YAB3001 TaxID=1520812 RepID=UPI0008F61A32|nr:hypothetical protein [Butyrivibrio sp. YAB3001]SFB69345.1 hypothetical protein SAMN02910398_00275 [Butyrivibrio sp. YAB3001]
MKIRKLGCLGIFLAAAISIAGCSNTVNTDVTATYEQEDAENAVAENDDNICGRSVAGFVIEKNDSKDSEKRAMYPYVVKAPSSIWFLAADDIELMGEEAFFAGLEEVLSMVDLDFTDAREALKDYINKDVASVEIYTDFCNKAGISANAGAYYNSVSNFIKLFYDWDQAKYSLLHEYCALPY